MKRVYNFAAGPAILPESVLKRAQAEMLDWNNSGMSVMEISHRGPAFMALVEQTQDLLRQLLNIPANYHLLFLASGARTQFSMIPINLLAKNPRANYLVTGTWSFLAYQEATKYGDIKNVLHNDQDILTIPEATTWDLYTDAAYCYYAPNETLSGLEFPYVPQVTMPLVADMTSCILSQPLDVSQFGLIYASAQKNMGQAGVTVVIIRDDLLQEPFSFAPSMYDYRNFVSSNSLYNTPPTYAIYMMNLVLQDLVAKGGVAAMAKINRQKAALLYEYIDASDFYVNRVDPRYRSIMNVTFTLPSEELQQQFLAQAAANHLMNLKGHKKIGGIRASIYNAMPLTGVEKLVQFMRKFVKEQA